MTDFRSQRRAAVQELEESLLKDARGLCCEIYQHIYNENLPPSPDALTALIHPPTGRLHGILQRANRERYHPMFISNIGGRFEWENSAARDVFSDLDFKSHQVVDLYANGVIFAHGPNMGPILPQAVAQEAVAIYKGQRDKERRRDHSQARFTRGNEFVFFFARDQRRLLVPVTGTLYVSCLRNHARGLLGTIGLMSVPLFLQRLDEKKPRGTIFIAMPFRPELDAVHDAIERAALCAGFEPRRIDQQHGPEIAPQIRQQILNSRAVIADLSGANPNVRYETGFAHALGKTVILINQDIIDSAPFNTKGDSQIKYDIDHLPTLSMKLLTVLRTPVL